jgi:aldehyde dehydrogenase (NAD+)
MIVQDFLKFYINGEWVDPIEPRVLDVENPATEEAFARISIGSARDVDKAVAAAREAFKTFSQTSVEERIALLDKITGALAARSEELAKTISQEMGAPMWLAAAAQAPVPIGHFATAAQILREYKFDQDLGRTKIRKEPVGVCGFITPWNWPANQVACKVAPAIATGCTVVLKPSEIAPLDAMLIAEVLHEAGVPPGVFNLVNGDGPGVGTAISSHPDIDMVSFTGSTRAGVLVSQAAAPTVKRVALELGGKSPNIVLPSADLQQAIPASVHGMMMNSGQSCNAPSRLFVPKDKNEDAKAIAKAVTEAIKVQPPETAEPGSLGPVSSKVQFDKIQDYIEIGIKEGATIVAGGAGRPEGMNKGYYTRPTVFGDVSNDMRIAREEIFGPVLVMIPYDTLDDAIEMANDTPYGLSGYVQGPEDEAREVGKQIRAGQILLNGATPDLAAPFGGYKTSGNGREWGAYGIEEFLEVKSMMA